MNSTPVFGDLRGLTPGAIAGQLSPRLPQIATWVLVILIAIQGALIAKSFFVDPVSEAEPQVAPPAATGPVRRPVDVQGIVDAHLFGEASAAEVQANPEEAPQTTLTLVLAGTIASNDPKKGLGIIGETAANAKVYSVGESIPGGVKLHAVYLDRVILDRSGTLEALLLPRQQPFSGANQPRMQLTNNAPGGMSSTPAQRLRSMIAQDPGSVAEIMRPQPVFANGQQRGYRVYPGRNRVSFQQLGLQPGDLVTAVNGTPLDDPARGMEIFRSIGSASQVKVTIERKGRQQELTLNMAQLADQAQGIPTTENLLPTEPPGDTSEQ